MECLSARTSAFVLAVSFLMAPPSHAEELQSRVPSYIEADRTQAEETLGGDACKRCVLGSLHRSAETADRKLSAR